MLDWVDKVDGVDDVLAEDINAIAHEVNNKADKGDYALLNGDVKFRVVEAEHLDVNNEAYVSEIPVAQSIKNNAASIESNKKNIENKADVLILESEKATPLVLTDTKKAPLVDYQIYGNSTQDGTPTPDNPVDIVSVGTLVTDETSEHYGKYEIPVTVCGKNLLPIKEAGTYKFGGSIGKIEIAEDGSIFIDNINNSTSVVQNVTVSGVFTVPRDGKYRFTEKGKTTRNLYTVITHKRSGEDTKYPNNQNTDRDYIDLDLKAGDTLTFLLQAKAGAVIENTTFYLQLEFGSVSTEYEPYKGATYNIYLDEPLRKIKATYSGEADVYDYIDFKRGVVVRNIAEGSVPTTGNNFEWNGANGRRYIFNVSKKKFGSSITTVGHFNLGTVKQSVIGGMNSNTLQAYSGSSGLYWYLDFSICGLDGTEEKAVAEAAFRNWLKTVDTTFTYVLNTPTETVITDLPEILTNYPTTTFICDGEVQVTYKADTTNVYNNLKSELDTLKQAIISVGGTV